MTPLTKEQKAYILERLVPADDTVPVRFFEDGCCVDLISGIPHKKGCNVMYHSVYWQFTRELALSVAKMTNTKPFFDGRIYADIAVSFEDYKRGPGPFTEEE